MHLPLGQTGCRMTGRTVTDLSSPVLGMFPGFGMFVTLSILPR